MPKQRPNRFPWKGIAACALALALWCSPVMAFQKTDVIVLTNGDRLTGEIKSYERGRLKLSTDGMGTIYIEWPYIASIRSDKMLEMELDTGDRLFGSVHPTESGEGIVVQTGLSASVVRQVDVVEITPIRETFWARLDGNIDFGFSFTQANTQVDYTLNASTVYRTRKNSFSADLSSFIRTQQQTRNTNRQDVVLGYKRDVSNRWFYSGVTSFQKNNELSLDFRTAVGGGAGRTLIRNNAVVFSALGGAVYNRERFSGAEESYNNLDALGTVDFQWFTFGDNETDLSTRFSLMPSLTTPGRFRLDLTANVKREIIKDFYFSINLFETYDSDPPQPDPETEPKKNDFGITASVGYKW